MSTLKKAFKLTEKLHIVQSFHAPPSPSPEAYKLHNHGVRLMIYYFQQKGILNDLTFKKQYSKNSYK